MSTTEGTSQDQADVAQPVDRREITSDVVESALADIRADAGMQAQDSIPDEELLYDLADLFQIFSDTTRIKILFSLMGKELCVVEIAQATMSTQSAVSHQLRILKAARLVRFRRDGRNIMYTLADDHIYMMLAQGMNHICE